MRLLLWAHSQVRTLQLCTRALLRQKSRVNSASTDIISQKTLVRQARINIAGMRMESIRGLVSSRKSCTNLWTTETKIPARSEIIERGLMGRWTIGVDVVVKARTGDTRNTKELRRLVWRTPTQISQPGR